MNKKDTYVVSANGDGDFATISETLSYVEHNHEAKEHLTIYIKNGLYKEKIMVTRGNLTFVGESNTGTILSYGDYAKMLLPDGSPYRTFHTYTMLIAANQITLKNLTIENTAGLGKDVGQAVALYVEGSRIKVEDVRLLGNQDTLFTGPLPHKPIEGKDFGGPMEGKERVVGKQYYKNCYIEGDIDFIFGSAVAVFEGCELFSKNLNQEINGYVTAASTYEGQEYGYVFIDCRFTSDAKEESVYLGRPWRNYAKTVLIGCELGNHIKREGWHDWNKEAARETVYYGEFKSVGPGASDENRVEWAHILTPEEAKQYTVEGILGDF